MTIQRHDGKPITSFSRWAYTNPRLDSIREGLSIMDIDWVIHRYLARCDTIGNRTVNHIMLIEEKRNLAPLPAAEGDTMGFVHQALRVADRRRMRSRFRNDRPITRYWGFHFLRYSGDEITLAEIVYWDKHRINLDILEKILLFDIDPNTLQPRSDRRHHTSAMGPLMKYMAE